jgi:hypothetical protein
VGFVGAELDARVSRTTSARDEQLARIERAVLDGLMLAVLVLQLVRGVIWHELERAMGIAGFIGIVAACKPDMLRGLVRRRPVVLVAIASLALMWLIAGGVVEIASITMLLLMLVPLLPASRMLWPVVGSVVCVPIVLVAMAAVQQATVRAQGGFLATDLNWSSSRMLLVSDVPDVVLLAGGLMVGGWVWVVGVATLRGQRKKI